MGIFSRPSASEKGYGKSDEKLNRALRSAKTKAEADTIARADGLKDAGDATAWLQERSS